MRRTSWILSALAAASMIAPVANADELKMTSPPQQAGAQGSSEQPARGMSMERVEARFGAPTNRVAAVGNPPIARWEYPGFVVYFEHNLVLHSVVKL